MKPRKVTHPGPFFHASPAEFDEGDTITPQAGSGGPEKVVFSSPDFGTAVEFGRIKAGGKGGFHLYEVEPEDGDTWSNPGRGVSHTLTHQKPVRVVRRWTSYDSAGELVGGDSRALNMYASGLNNREKRTTAFKDGTKT